MVGGKKYSYTKAGMKDAQKHSAKKTGKKMMCQEKEKVKRKFKRVAKDKTSGLPKNTFQGPSPRPLKPGRSRTRPDDTSRAFRLTSRQSQSPV